MADARSRKPPSLAGYWIAAPLVYGAAADVTANIYFLIAKGQLGFPGPVFLVMLLGIFISFPVAVAALALSAIVKWRKAVLLPIAGALYAATLGALFVFGMQSATIGPLDELVVCVLGPAVVLAFVGRLWGKGIDAIAQPPTP